MPPEVFLLNILEEILNDKNRISIQKDIDEFWILLSISVKKSDLPLLIGKWWKTIDSIRHILRVYWFSRNQRINLKIIES